MATVKSTIAEMQSFNPASDSTVIVLSYSEVNDGGGGLFNWIPNDSTPTDGGTIFASTYPGATGRWMRVWGGGALNVRWFGAKADGRSGGGNAIQLALDAAGPGPDPNNPRRVRTVFIPNGSYNITQTLIIESANSLVRLDRTIVGEGDQTYLYCSSAFSGAILRKLMRSDAQHGNTFQIEGIKFDAQSTNAIGVLVDTLNAQTSDKQGPDMLVSHCSFVGPGTGIKLVGTREPQINETTFDIGTVGVYLNKTANPSVNDCFFRTIQPDVYQVALGIHYDGQGETKYDAGLKVTGCTFIGLYSAVKAYGTDWIEISSCIIDYCDLPIELIKQDTALIQGNWIGAFRRYGSASLTIAIKVYGVGSTLCNHIRIVDNRVVTYADGAPQRTGIHVRKTYGLQIANNTIDFWNAFGIDNAGSPYDCSLVAIEDNEILSSPPNTGTRVGRPVAGEAIITPGNTTVVVQHGLGTYPARVYLTATAVTPCGVIIRDSVSLTISIGSTFPYNVGIFWKVYADQ